MKCNFSGDTRREDPLIHFENHELSQKSHFKYLGSIIDTKRAFDEDG